MLRAGEGGVRVDLPGEHFQAGAIRTISHNDQARLHFGGQGCQGVQQGIHPFTRLQTAHEEDLRVSFDVRRARDRRCGRAGGNGVGGHKNMGGIHTRFDVLLGAAGGISDDRLHVAQQVAVQQ